VTHVQIQVQKLFGPGFHVESHCLRTCVQCDVRSYPETWRFAQQSSIHWRKLMWVMWKGL